MVIKVLVLCQRKSGRINMDKENENNNLVEKEIIVPLEKYVKKKLGGDIIFEYLSDKRRLLNGTKLDGNVNYEMKFGANNNTRKFVDEHRNSYSLIIIHDCDYFSIIKNEKLLELLYELLEKDGKLYLKSFSSKYRNGNAGGEDLFDEVLKRMVRGKKELDVNNSGNVYFTNIDDNKKRREEIQDNFSRYFEKIGLNEYQKVQRGGSPIGDYYPNFLKNLRKDEQIIINLRNNTEIRIIKHKKDPKKLGVEKGSTFDLYYWNKNFTEGNWIYGLTEERLIIELRKVLLKNDFNDFCGKLPGSSIFGNSWKKVREGCVWKNVENIEYTKKRVLVLCQRRTGKIGNGIDNINVETYVVPYLEKYVKNRIGDNIKFEYLSKLIFYKGNVNYNFLLGGNEIETQEFLKKNRNQYSLIVMNTCPLILLRDESFLKIIYDLLRPRGLLLVKAFTFKKQNGDIGNINNFIDENIFNKYFRKIDDNEYMKI